MVIFAMMTVWGVSRTADRRANMAETLEAKLVEGYIATGEVKHALHAV